MAFQVTDEALDKLDSLDEPGKRAVLGHMTDEERRQVIGAVPAWRERKGLRGDPGAFRSAAVKFAEGATKGWSDELGGAIGKSIVGEPVRVPGAEGPGAYELTRDPMRREQHQAQSHRPILSGVSQAAGDIASDFLIGRTGVPVASLPYQVAMGAVAGAGMSEGETGADVALDSGVGAGVSGLAYGVGRYALGPLAAKAAPGLRKWLKDFAAERAIKATGAIQSDIKGLPRERLLDQGRQLLEQGVITPGASKSAVLERAGEGIERAGATIGGILEQADKEATRRLPESFDRYEAGSFDWRPVVERLKSSLGRMSETEQRAAASALRYLDDIEGAAASAEGYAAANRIKTAIQKGINWAAEPKVTSGAAKQIQGVLDDEVERQLAQNLGGQIADEYKSAKSLFGAFKTAEKGSRKGLERQLGNRITSPSDMGLGMAQYAGDVAGGGDELMSLGKAALVSTAHKIARERGASVAATGAKALSESKTMMGLLRSAPQTLGKFAAPLLRAYENGGDDAVAVTDYVLSQQSPEYREARRKALEED